MMSLARSVCKRLTFLADSTAGGEKDQLSLQVEKLEKQLVNQSDQNASLRNENEDLRQQLGLEVLIFLLPV